MADKAQIIELLEALSDVYAEQKQFLTELDIAIGDGDHGINMDRGFKAVKEFIPTFENLEASAVLVEAGKKIMSAVGGSAGPLYGSLFRKAGVYLRNKPENNGTVTIQDLPEMLSSGIEAIQKLGNAVEDEKTILDAMIPALRAMKSSLENGSEAVEVLKAGVEAAEAGVEHTKSLIATKGRATYYGERNIGHQDPGATSFMMLLQTLQKKVEKWSA